MVENESYLPYIDFHCDTAYELYHRKSSLMKNNLAISVKDFSRYEHYAQFFAIWGNARLSDNEVFEDFIHISDYFNEELKKEDVYSNICLARTAKDLHTAWTNHKNVAFLAVEDARLLDGDISRIKVLAERGVKYLTLLWGGDTCIGGSHDTEHGLTDFGKDVVRACAEYGIIPDISHASAQSAEDTLNIATQLHYPVIATHSDAYSVYPHSRNLRDDHFRQIQELGGIVGLNLCTVHLRNTEERPADIRDIGDHLAYYLNQLNAKDNLCIGGDLDGTDLPQGFHTVSDIIQIKDEIINHGYDSDLAAKIFYQNALRFIDQNF